MKFESAIPFIGWLASISHWKLFKTTQILPFIKLKHTSTFKMNFYVSALWKGSLKHQELVYLANNICKLTDLVSIHDLHFPRICPVKLFYHSFVILNQSVVILLISSIKSCFVNRQLIFTVWQISVPLRSSIIYTRCHLQNLIHFQDHNARGNKPPALIDYCILLPLGATINNSRQWGIFVLCKDMVLSQTLRSPIHGDLRNCTTVLTSF